MSESENEFFQQLELGIAASDAEEATEAKNAIMTAKQKESDALERLKNSDSDLEAIRAQIDVDNANQDVTRAMGKASRMEWELSQIVGGE